MQISIELADLTLMLGVLVLVLAILSIPFYTARYASKAAWDVIRTANLKGNNGQWEAYVIACHIRDAERDKLYLNLQIGLSLYNSLSLLFFSKIYFNSGDVASIFNGAVVVLGILLPLYFCLRTAENRKETKDILCKIKSNLAVKTLTVESVSKMDKDKILTSGVSDTTVIKLN